MNFAFRTQIFYTKFGVNLSNSYGSHALSRGLLNKPKPASYKVYCFLYIIEVQLEQQTIPSEVRYV